MRKRTEDDIKQIGIKIDLLKRKSDFNTYDSQYQDLLKLMQRRKNALKNLNDEKWVAHYKKKEEESWKYYKIQNAKEIKEACLYCMMIIQEAIWINFLNIFNKKEEKIMKGLIGFLQWIYARIDEEDDTIHITIKETFDVFIRDFSFLLVKHEEIFDRKAQKGNVQVTPNESLRTLNLDERNKLLESYFNEIEYLEILEQEELKNLASYLYEKLNQKERYNLLLNIADKIKVKPFTIINLIQKLSDIDKKILSNHLTDILITDSQ